MGRVEDISMIVDDVWKFVEICNFWRSVGTHLVNNRIIFVVEKVFTQKVPSSREISNSVGEPISDRVGTP